jgi:hypothetical protein
MNLYKLIFCILLSISCLLIAIPSKSQNPAVKDTVKTNSSRVKQKDIVDVIQGLFKKRDTIPLEINPDFTVNKSLGPFNSGLLYPGYSLVTSYQAVFAGDISFYADTIWDRKLSDIFVYSLYSANKQWVEVVKSNIWTRHNKLNLVGDWRYYKFPTDIYGLGGESTLTKSNNIDYSYLRLYEAATFSVRKNINIGLGYNLDSYWNITEGQHDSVTGIYGMDLYGFKTETFSSGISLDALYDNRLNVNNPQEGSYANIQLRQNLRILGSDNDWTSMVVDLRHYIPFPKHPGNILALWSYNWLTLFGVPPYLDLPSNGWDSDNSTGRGYIQGRFRGANFVYLESEYRYPITQNGLFGGVVFINSTLISEPNTNEFSKINLGAGFGLRIKVNKDARTNLAIDYGFGAEGSRGFFFNLNEVF